MSDLSSAPAGKWLCRYEKQKVHRCQPPQLVGSFDSWADGNVDDVWQCDCTVIWVVKWRKLRPRWRIAIKFGLVWWRYVGRPAIGRFFTSLGDGLSHLFNDGI